MTRLLPTRARHAIATASELVSADGDVDSAYRGLKATITVEHEGKTIRVAEGTIQRLTLHREVYGSMYGDTTAYTPSRMITIDLVKDD